MKRSTTTATLAAIMMAFALSSAAFAQNQKPPTQKQFNLQGVWIDQEDGGEVKITQNGASVTAVYTKESTCEYGETVERVQGGFQGTLEGNELKNGKAVTCYFGHGPKALGIKRDDEIKLTVSDDGNTLTAIQQVRFREPFTFTLTRKKVEFMINASTFIPFNYLKGPPQYLCRSGVSVRQVYMHGDGADRYFSPTSPAFRTRQLVTVVTEKSVDDDGTKGSIPAPQVGESRSYASDALADGIIDAKDDDAVLGDCHLLHERATAGGTGLNLDVTRINEHKISVHIYGVAKHPLLKSSCAINWDYTITLDTSGPTPLYSLKGEHDGFPGYEVYIDDYKIHGRVPSGTNFDDISKLCAPRVNVKVDSGDPRPLPANP